ncbi:MAG TPA: DUF1214 domain-containing protein [Gaiellales bacterium]|nr:DUF1214 domain-containing protein [Gaiellales bacterium]
MTTLTTSIAPFGAFRSDLPPEEIAQADTVRLRTLACWAYIYLMPAFLFVRQRSEFVQGWERAAKAGAPVTSGVSAGAVGVAGAPALGSWMMLPKLTDDRTRTILPQHDCVYGAAHVELDRLGPIVISIPENPERRYYSVAVLDAFMNNVAHLGPKWTGNSAGEHLLVGPEWDGDTPAWAASVVRSPTVSAVLYHRALVGFKSGDIDVVRRWREGFTLTQLSRYGGSSDSPVDPGVKTDDLVHGDMRTMTDPSAYFRIAVEHLQHNPQPTENAWLTALLTETPFPELTNERSRDAVLAGVADAQRILDGAISGAERRHGWEIPFAHTGEPGPYVLQQAITQIRAVGANDPAESVYILGLRDGDDQPLDASDGSVYELRFDAGKLPPLEEPGFWSATMYRASDGYLVANPINRYSIRTTLPGFERAADGSATIVMAAALPEGVTEANWLPAPKDEPFLVCLRLYYPLEPIRDGIWFPPPIERRP